MKLIMVQKKFNTENKYKLTYNSWPGLWKGVL